MSLGNAIANENTVSQKISESTADDSKILVGFYGSTITNLSGTSLKSDIKNTSWMLNTTNGILMNDEWYSILYLVDNSTFSTKKSQPLNSVASPVYISPEINSRIYIAGYGESVEEGQKPAKGGVIVTDSTLKNVKEYLTNQSGSRIHFVDQFKSKDVNGNDFIIAVDLGLKKLHKFDPDTGTFSHLYDFKDAMPRHFVQIPGTNQIVVIIEQPQAQAQLILMEYKGNEFNVLNSFDLNKLLSINSNADKGLTGAEVKYHNNKLYATVRTYTAPFKAAPTNTDSDNRLNTVSTGGILAEFTINDNNTIELSNQVTVGKNPRYFSIDDTTNTAYVVNQEARNITLVNLDTMGTIKTINMVLDPTQDPNIAPVFILLPKQ